MKYRHLSWSLAWLSFLAGCGSSGSLPTVPPPPAGAEAGAAPGAGASAGASKSKPGAAGKAGPPQKMSPTATLKD